MLRSAVVPVRMRAYVADIEEGMIYTYLKRRHPRSVITKIGLNKPKFLLTSGIILRKYWFDNLSASSVIYWLIDALFCGKEYTSIDRKSVV